MLEKIIASPFWNWSGKKHQLLGTNIRGELFQSTILRNGTVSRRTIQSASYFVFIIHMFYIPFDLGDMRECEERYFMSTLNRFEYSLNYLAVGSTRLTQL